MSKYISIIVLVISILQTHAFLWDMSVEELKYGNLGNLENLFVLPFNDSIVEKEAFKEEPGYDVDEDDDDDFKIFDEIIKTDDPHKSYDVNDFNQIKFNLNDTRRRYKWGYSWGKADSQNPKHITEQTKKTMLINICIQFVIHSRQKISGALRQRTIVQRDKRYRLGYLFNRIRRLIMEMRKLTSIAYNQYISKRTSYENLKSTLSIYQRVTRLDVDIVDTRDLIKRVFGEPSYIDEVGVQKEDKSKRWKPKEKKEETD